MSKIICKICLRTDLETSDTQETLVDFYDEITEYAINENSTLKYCSLCEHLLKKFYNFSRKCIKANKILKAFIKEKKGGFPHHLHELLPPKYSLGRSIPSTLQQFNLNNGNLEPLSMQLLIKQENDTNELENYLEYNDDKEAINTLSTNEVFQEHYIQINEPGNRCSVKINTASDNTIDIQKRARRNKTVTEMAVKDLENENNPTENEKELSLLKLQLTLKETKKLEDQNICELEVKLKDNSSEQENDSTKDSSVTDKINTFEKRMPAKRQSKLSKKGSPISKKQQRPKKPLKNRMEYENVFDIQVFATDEEAKEELELRKSSEPYLSAEHKCGICYTVYRCAKLLEFHTQWHDPSAGDHECDVCLMRFENRRAVSRHKHNSHWGKFTCKNCPMITYYKGAMAKHYQHHVGLIFACKLCDHTFNHPLAYKSHLRMSHKTDHVCETCARTFVSEKGLHAHRIIIHKTKSKVNSDDPAAHCAPCGLTFANEQVYTVHIMSSETHKDLAKSIIACRVCGVRFEDEKDLKEHRRSHNLNYKTKQNKLVNTKLSDKDPYNCPICGMVGTSHLWVCRHIVSAHPDSPYVKDLAKRRQHMCDTCGKCYTTKQALQDHMNLHSGARRFACASCPARFHSRTRLKLHLERHEPAKRECPRCRKKFVSAANLSSHMRTHIQDRRYKCSVCGKGFLHASTMRVHVRGVHHNVQRTRKRRRESVAYESS